MSTLQETKTACQELIDLMGLQNEDKTPVLITGKTTQKDMEDIILKASEFIEPTDVLKEVTTKVITELTPSKTEPEEITNEEDPATKSHTEILEAIDDAQKFSQLKNIAKQYDEFKDIRGKLSSFKAASELKTALLEIMGVVEEKPQATAEKLHEKNIEKKPIKTKVEVAPVVSKVSIMDTKDIVTEAPFKDLFPIHEPILESIIENMTKFGYDSAFPVVLWGKIVIDGHTRLDAAEALGIVSIPVEQKDFVNKQEALEYAVHNQRDRRNMTDSELLTCIEVLDKPMTKSEAASLAKSSNPDVRAGKGETSKKTAKILGVGKTKIEKARKVLKDPEMKKDVLEGAKTIETAAKEIKHRDAPPKKTSRTRIQAVAVVLKEFAGTSQEKAVINEEADICYEDWGGDANLKLISEAALVVYEVLHALELITFEKDGKIKLSEKLG